MEAATTPRNYGFDVSASIYGPRGIVQHPTTTATGNIVLRAGNELGGYDPTVNKWQTDNRGWESTVHIVLTPEEARTLAVGILQSIELDESDD